MALSNLTELLLRNQSAFNGPVLLIGPPEDLPLGAWPEATALSTDIGQCQRGIAGGENWLFGYDDPAAGKEYGAVVLVMPKAREELSLRLAYGESLLKAGGEIWLAGEKRGGIAGGAGVLQQRWPKAVKLDSARHCQLWCVRPDRQGPFAVADWLSLRQLNVAGQTLSLARMPGVFNDGLIDRGTELLLSTFKEQPKGPVLDFACGNGVMGAWLLQQWPDLELDLLDAQWQALRCTQESLAEALAVPAEGDAKARLIASDGLEKVDGPYDLIIANPPFHQGVRQDLSVTHHFLLQASSRLKRGGELRIVANRHLPYAEPMEKSLGPVTQLADDGRYRVYQSFKPRRPVRRK
ncbi:MAG: class I SAM-dependent methyltransferase [Halomonadaceae bacterium]|nr:MAG: class I SAM-dependent methyltransferase [Halomonadaceae bacterium]